MSFGEKLKKAKNLVWYGADQPYMSGDETEYYDDQEYVNNTVDFGETRSTQSVSPVREGQTYDFEVIHVTSLSENLGDMIITFKKNTPIILNFDEISSKDEAQRMIDIAYGLAKGLDGHLEEISENNYILSPVGFNVNSNIKSRNDSGIIQFDK
ncbi:MAG: cell division protein SepF [Candidatus Ancillula sp.]|jgi:FtsZ-interacting cell division protein YlmF|nr:cell division protein SepF [Candidatus Ancillula sp.]